MLLIGMLSCNYIKGFSAIHGTYIIWYLNNWSNFLLLKTGNIRPVFTYNEVYMIELNIIVK